MVLTSQPFVARILGAFVENIPSSQEYLTLSFSPTAAPRNQRWSNYGLSADFLGDYFANFFPGDQPSESKINRRDTIKAGVSYIANELIENAVKYSSDSTTLPISITLYLYEQALIFKVTNYATLQRVELYQAFIQTLLESNIDEFYIQQLENTAIGNGTSNMGLLTMINDYGATFGWKFQPVDRDVVRVTVMARLAI
jgi:hypothetical protein